MEKEWTIKAVETREVEDTESDIRIVSDLGEGDGEIEIIVELTKIGEGREERKGSGEEMKGREVKMVGEECGWDTTGSTTWPLHNFGTLFSSDPLAFSFELLFSFWLLILLMEWLSLWRSDCCYLLSAWIFDFNSCKLVQTESWKLTNCPLMSCTSCYTSDSWSSNLRKESRISGGSLWLGVLEPKSMSI